MRDYLVELEGEAREVYVVTAESKEDAEARWADGSLVVSEVFGMDVVSVREDDE